MVSAMGTPSLHRLVHKGSHTKCSHIPSPAEVSNCGVADSPATVGRKKGAASGFLGGWIGLRGGRAWVVQADPSMPQVADTHYR